MKPDSQVRFTIIGLGKLMEVIWHCFTNSIGGHNSAARAIATTADKDDIERKRDLFKIPVWLENNLEALKTNQPDIIFFSPPPSIAPGEIHTTLKEYFSWVRRQELPLPEIYAFPPLPPGQFYRDTLGADVVVCNIIPNNVNRIAGRQVEDEGYYACSFSGVWHTASKQRLQRIFSSQGTMVEVPADQLVPMLGGTCTFFSLWHVVPALADILQSHGLQISHNHVGEYMRALCQKLSGFVPASSDPAFFSVVSGPPAILLDAITRSWRDGVARYYADIAFPEGASRTIIERGFDVILHTTQCESREALYEYAVGAATKGGVLEKANATFNALIKPVLERGVATLARGVSTDWQNDLTAKVTETAHIVGRHGLRLAG